MVRDGKYCRQILTCFGNSVAVIFWYSASERKLMSQDHFLTTAELDIEAILWHGLPIITGNSRMCVRGMFAHRKNKPCRRCQTSFLSGAPDENSRPVLRSQLIDPFPRKKKEIIFRRVRSTCSIKYLKE